MKCFSPFRLDTVNQCLWRDDTRISLRPKAFAVLSYLVQHAGRLVAQSELLEALWPGTFVQPDVLKTHILEIRAALGDDPKHPIFIETLTRRGYCFIQKVTEATPQGVSMAHGVGIVGRDRELEKLYQYLGRASAGEQQIVFVTGEAGIGKTTLVSAFMERAYGMRISRGQCMEGYGVQEPYYPVLVALGKLLREEKSLIPLLEAHAPTWLVQFPGLLTPEHRQTLEREILGATRQRMVRELCDLIPLITTEKTFLLILEDIHWADSATVELIAAIAHLQTPARFMLLATYRPVAAALPEHPLKLVKQDLAIHGRCHEVRVEPLGEAEVAQYLMAQSPGAGLPRGLAELMHRFCEGNPLFLRAALDHLLARGFLACGKSEWSVHVPLSEFVVEVPDSLRQMLELQVDRLTNASEERNVLEAAGVCGVLFLAEVAAAVAGFDLEKYEEICQSLVHQHHLLQTAGLKTLPNGTTTPRYRFVHAFYQRAIYDRMPRQRRARLHLRAGESLEALYAEAPGKVASELALHFEAGGDWKKAAKYLQLVAANKGQRFAYREAVPDLEHALELLAKLPAGERAAGETQVMMKLGAIYFALDEASRSLSIAQTVAERAAQNHDSLTEIHVLMQMGITLGRISVAQAEDVVNRLLGLSEREENPVLRARGRMAALSLRLSAAAPKEEDAQQFRAALDQLGSQAEHASGYHLFQLFLSQYQDSAKGMEKSLPLFIETGDIRHRAAILHFILGLTLAGNWGKALCTAQDAVAIAEKNGNRSRENVLRLYQALPHLFAGDWAGAHRLCEAALRMLSDPYEAIFLRQGLILAGTALVGLGQYESAWLYLAQARQQMEAQPLALEWYWRLPLQSALTELSLRRGDLKQAGVEAQRFVESAMMTAERTWQALAWEASARVALAGSNADEAKKCIAKAIAAMQGFDAPLAYWRVHATAMQLFPEATEVYKRQAAAGIMRLAESLKDFPTLQEKFLSSEWARRVSLAVAPLGKMKSHHLSAVRPAAIPAG